MFRLCERSAADGVAHHRMNPVREYAEDGVQNERIARARKALTAALNEVTFTSIGEVTPVRTIVELGCGVLDISGPQSDVHEVIGVECNEAVARRANELYPRAVVSNLPIEHVEPFPCDVLVMCEVLEHLENPVGLVSRWLPMARTCVISHPLNEPKGSGLSGGDHCWSFSETDFASWFEYGAHQVQLSESFAMGSYRIGLAMGRRL